MLIETSGRAGTNPIVSRGHDQSCCGILGHAEALVDRALESNLQKSEYEGDKIFHRHSQPTRLLYGNYTMTTINPRWR